MRLFIGAILIMQLFGCSSLVNALAFHPQRGARVDLQEFDQRIEEIEIGSEGGVRLQAYFMSAGEDSPVVLYFHGNAGNASHRLEGAVELARRGLSVLLLSYRGYGQSEGSPSETGVYADGRAAYDYLRKERSFESAQIFVYGRSLGSAVAVDLAMQRDIAGMILVTPLSSGRAFASHHGFGWIAWLTGQPFHSIRKVETLELPALFIHGDRDEVIPLEQARALFEAYGGEKSFTEVPGAGHNDLIPAVGADRYWDWVHEFISRTR